MLLIIKVLFSSAVHKCLKCAKQTESTDWIFLLPTDVGI